VISPYLHINPRHKSSLLTPKIGARIRYIRRITTSPQWNHRHKRRSIFLGIIFPQELRRPALTVSIHLYKPRRKAPLYSQPRARKLRAYSVKTDIIRCILQRHRFRRIRRRGLRSVVPNETRLRPDCSCGRDLDEATPFLLLLHVRNDDHDGHVD
jgi:hypothetical protein